MGEPAQGRSADSTGEARARRIVQRAAGWIRGPAGLSALVAVIAAVVLWLVIQPLARATADTDAAASVMYFDRIVHGHRLEAFFPTTPKPLLTLVYGLAWSLTHDWHSLAVMTLMVGALGVGLAARLAARLGGIAAAAFVAIGLVAWPTFRLETADANSFVWGLALWLLAGVLITAERPRPWLAGLALLLAGLARTETAWLVAAAACCAAVVVIRARRTGDRSQLRLILPLLIGVLAVPLACLHDLLLSGKPFYWLSVPGGYTALTYPNLASVSPLTVLHEQAVHYRPLLALMLVAAVGIAWLASTRWRPVSFALVAFTGGVLLTLVGLGWRGIYISERYYEESDAAILLAAAVGGGLLVRRVLDWTGNRMAGRGAGARAGSRPWLRQAALGGVAALLALGVAWQVVPQAGVEALLARSAQADVALRAAEPQLAAIVAGADGATLTVSGVSYPVSDPRACRAFVPRSLLPRISVDTGAPTPVLGDSFLAFRDGDYSVLSPGQWVLHIAAGDGSGGVFAPFEHSVPTTLTVKTGVALTILPVFVDEQMGVWLLRVDAAG